MYAILADFYLRYTAATAAGVGTAMILSKIIDALTDPPVGYLSDRTRSRLGARKPWIAAGALLGILTLWYFFNPPVDAGNGYFLVGIVLYYQVSTLVFIPYRSWLGEVSRDYADRSRIWSWYTIALLLGGLLIMVLPLALSSPWLPLFSSAEFDRDMISFIGKVGMVGLPLTLLIAIARVPPGERNIGSAPRMSEFFHVLRDAAPFRAFLAGYGFSALGFGIFYSSIVVGLTSYYGFADRVPLFMLVVIVVQVVSIPIWERIARIHGKHRVWALAWIGHAVLAPSILVFEPHTEFFWPFVVLSSLLSVLQGPHMLFPVSIVSDIVDYDTLKNRTSRAGNFFSLFTFIDKLLHALGYGIGFYLLALFGYDPKASQHGALAVTGLMLAIVFVPSACFGASGLALLRFPIDARRHSIIRRRIEARTARAARCAREGFPS
jgi:Na+/melibiose symporter-like transporter